MSSDQSSTGKVLVTGASGFIALHCIVQLLQQGYAVRGTLRSPAMASRLRQIVAGQIDADHRLEFAQADLLFDDGWPAAVAGCDYLLHIASPFPAAAPRQEEDVIVPARDGTLRVLRASAAAGVKRVVLTSSIVAIIAGRKAGGRVFDEDDWSDADGDSGAYEKSKTLAERAAWEYVRQLEDQSPLELVAINPGFVWGPILDGQHDLVTSGLLLERLMRRQVPGCVSLDFQAVDVRDVAALHVAALTNPAAPGRRFICVAENLWMQEVALILDRHFSGQGYHIPTRKIPDIAAYLVAIFDKTARQVLGGLGQRYELSNDSIREVFDWRFRPAEESIVAMAESMIEHGLV